MWTVFRMRSIGAGVSQTYTGTLLADHFVSLDASASEYAGFLDLEAYVSEHAAPDRRQIDEHELVQRVGAWIGEHVFGPAAERILAAGTPVTVRVRIPPKPEAALGLLYRPLELAHARGRPLALQDVSLVMEMGGR